MRGYGVPLALTFGQPLDPDFFFEIFLRIHNIAEHKIEERRNDGPRSNLRYRREGESNQADIERRRLRSSCGYMYESLMSRPVYCVFIGIERRNTRDEQYSRGIDYKKWQL